MKIKHSKYVIASRVGDTIYIHPELHTKPALYKAIMLHEKEHTDTFRLQDLLLDLDNHHIREVKKDFYSFILKHPSTLVGFLPLIRIDKKWVFDVVMAGFWASAIAVVVLTILLWR